MIAEHGSEWIASGALSSLVSSAEAFPQAVLEAHPRALAHRAEVARLRGEYDAAQSHFRRAATLLHEQDDKEGEAEALHSLATISRRRGDCAAAFTYLDRALELTRRAFGRARQVRQHARAVFDGDGRVDGGRARVS